MKDERENFILDELKIKGFITIEDISKRLNVSKMTIRRDFKNLENEHKLTRTHGGAKLIDTLHVEMEKKYLERYIENIENKNYIASLAAKTIKENDIVYIGPGTTVERILDFTKNTKFTLVTNSFSIIKKFSNSNIKLIILGGVLKLETEAIKPNLFYETIKKLNVDKAFVGSNGITPFKITSSDYSELATEEIILKNAKFKYVLADHTKFEKEAMYNFISPEEVSSIFTDNKIDPLILKKYSSIYSIVNE